MDKETKEWAIGCVMAACLVVCAFVLVAAALGLAWRALRFFAGF